MIRLVLVLFVASFAVPTPTHADDPPPYRITHPADRVTCFSPGLETSPITTCAITTTAGLVIIDTGLSPSMAGRTRTRLTDEPQCLAAFDHERNMVDGPQNLPLTPFEDPVEKWR